MSTQGWRAVCNESCKHGSGRGTRHALWANGPYSTLSVAHPPVRRADDHLERYGLPCGGGRSDQPQTVSARRVGGPDVGGDGALDVDARLSFEEGDSSGLGLFSGTSGILHTFGDMTLWNIW